MPHQFLPMNYNEMKERNLESLDFIIVSGDAYVDHPSFGTAIIGRILEANGYSVGVIAQPNWKTTTDIQKLGVPNFAFLVTAGNIDSMVNHYTVAKKKRNEDTYTPGGKPFMRPDRATIVYSNLIKQIYKDVPIIIGGIEASLRRLAHYDYWDDSVRRSVLLDSQADLLIYGMAEKTIIEVADALKSGIPIGEITYVNGTVYKTNKSEDVFEAQTLPTYEQIKKDKKQYATSFYMQYQNTDPFTAKRLIEPYSNNTYIVQNPPARPLKQNEMDRIYSLPYTRQYHPEYKELGGIPAITEVKYSLISNRGCFGSCNFCALTFHQGRIIQTRSHESIIREAEQFVWEDDFKGYIHDVGGPTANFRQPACEKQLTNGACKDRNCLTPQPCKQLKVDHSDYVSLLRKLSELPKVKKVFVRSGIRFDYLIYDKSDTFLKELTKNHISGQLKVAPEHVSNKVLALMGKPNHQVYKQFTDKYNKMNQMLSKEQYLVPYLMSSHPGSTLKDAIELAEYLRDIKFVPKQVQDFYPTPSTLSTCMYYTELDPRNMQKVYVPKTPHEKAMQRALIQFHNPKNYHLVYEALKTAGREDLIGYDKKCLIRPKKGDKSNNITQVINKPKPKKKKTIRNIQKKKK